MERILENKMEDFRQLGLPEHYKRECPVHQVSEMVSVIIGARRAGKSYRAFQVAAEMMRSGELPSINHICPVDFDNPYFSSLTAIDLAGIQKTFLKMNPAFQLQTPILYIFDEIHLISQWEKYVVDLSRNKNWKVLVTGSSSKMLRDDIATELRGKSISSIVYPLSFKEFLRFKNFRKSVESTVGQAEITRLFDEYLQWGAFPAVTSADNRVKEPLLREYFDVMMLRDIVQRYGISQPRACATLLRHLLSNIAQPFTVKSCFEYVKNAGFHVARDSVDNWITAAQDSWLLFSVPIFSSSTKEQQRNYRKMYCVDWALANCNSTVWDGGQSRAMENMVFIHLHQRWARVHYYLTRTKRQEVDFVCVDNRGKIGCLIQVCIDPTDPSTLRREIEPLVTAAQYFKCRECCIITRSEEKTLEDSGIRIRFVPAWRWLLNG